ncbi:hypothetical protein PRSY57_0405800 [Plasmodium reichenowi]|uniref:Uncharacterized protein n=1 Tax=Plasmodium reichenowi TaxID=5854 RepID=A0A151LSA3_PLARE|nr:hypothetical protein PRSY57_0405800 [Plasmodium reichenowi]KYO02065.1 hypothetical protein PRSY57_0405800 [Plasmodium reichenowi]
MSLLNRKETSLMLNFFLKNVRNIHSFKHKCDIILNKKVIKWRSQKIGLFNKVCQRKSFTSLEYEQRNNKNEKDEEDKKFNGDNNISDNEKYNEDEEDDKYIKSFYEMYDNNKDTYDCPKELMRFIIKEHMNVKIKIKCSSPRNMKKSDIKNIIKNMFEKSNINQQNNINKADIHNGKNEIHNNTNEKNYDIYYLSSNFKNYNYPDRNVLWPNPLVYNHRLQPFILKKEKEQNVNDMNNKKNRNNLNDNFEKDKENIERNKKRLENLWSYSSSYGIDWNTLDELFLNYKTKKNEHQNEWEKYKSNIMMYASKVCKRKLINSRKKLLNELNIDYSNNIYANYDDRSIKNEQINLDEDNTEYNLLLPRSIFRKWTRTLYYYWKDKYMHYYHNTLCDYLKGEIVDLQLLREHNERNLNISNKKMINKHTYNLKPVTGSNLYITRYIKRKNNNEENDDTFDLTGVGENIYNTVKRE